MANTPVRQYIGARYVPLFADPAEWNNQQTYEPLTIVIHNGNSYTSRQYVPIGIDINNNEYWALTGNYNAQIEEYRKNAQAGQTANDLLTHMGITNNETAGGHINDIENNHRDTLANTSALTALGAETVDKATMLKKTVDDLKAEADKKTLLVFGDSISVGAQGGISKNYVTQVAEYLGYTVKNYAINGSAFYGFRGDIVNISQQILNAHNDATLDKTKIGMIILGGGVNDTSDGNTIEQTYSGAKSCAQLLTEYFPDIPTYVMVGQGNGNWSDKTYMHNRLPYYSQIITAFNHYGKCTVINAWSILIGYPTDQGDSPWLVYNNLPDTHPSQTGHNIMASHLIGCINGNNIGKYAAITNELTTDGTPIYNYVSPKTLSLSVVEISDIAYTVIFDCEWQTEQTTENEEYIFAYANNQKLFSPGYSFTASGSYVDASGKISTCDATIKFNKDNQFTITTGHRDTSITGHIIHLHAEHTNILWN